jgi:hypothetical protein
MLGSALCDCTGLCHLSTLLFELGSVGRRMLAQFDQTWTSLTSLRPTSETRGAPYQQRAQTMDGAVTAAEREITNMRVAAVELATKMAATDVALLKRRITTVKIKVAALEVSTNPGWASSHTLPSSHAPSAHPSFVKYTHISAVPGSHRRQLVCSGEGVQMWIKCLQFRLVARSVRAPALALG